MWGHFRRCHEWKQGPVGSGAVAPTNTVNTLNGDVGNDQMIAALNDVIDLRGFGLANLAALDKFMIQVGAELPPLSEKRPGTWGWGLDEIGNFGPGGWGSQALALAIRRWQHGGGRRRLARPLLRVNSSAGRPLAGATGGGCLTARQSV